MLDWRRLSPALARGVVPWAAEAFLTGRTSPKEDADASKVQGRAPQASCWSDSGADRAGEGGPGPGRGRPGRDGGGPGGDILQPGQFIKNNFRFVPRNIT